MMPRHYIIVVHGIGEQRLNQTTVEVIHRFAEVRQNQPQKYFHHLLPANISGQSVRLRGQGHAWSEFKGIPIEPAAAGASDTFDGTPETEHSGENFRFVDLYWGDILQRHQERYASPAEVWAPRLNARLNLAPSDWIPQWARRLLLTIEDAAIPAKKLLAFAKPALAKLTFEDYLGDVHLYGDYTRTRGHAVRRFHAILDEIHLRDLIEWYDCEIDRKEQNPQYQFAAYTPPEYSIIAHSLGSIMSFDALVYAFAKENVRMLVSGERHACPSLPFPGYTDPWLDVGETTGEEETWQHLMHRLQRVRNRAAGQAGGEPKAEGLISTYLKWSQQDEQEKALGSQRIPPLVWREQVRNFVTLGSPIDKYHVIWYQNYMHMGLRYNGQLIFPDVAPQCVGTWLEKSPDAKIRHYNFCDEQDPVGHHLDRAQASVHYPDVFDTTSVPIAYRDVVFRRYSVPGVAHNMYWGDRDLFSGIVQEVIDRQPPAHDAELTEAEKQRQLKGSFFLSEQFRETGKAYRKALQWAYFRIPFIATLATAALLIYGLFIGNENLYRIAAILGAVFLWTKPTVAKKYKQEARPENPQAFRVPWKFNRGIFAHLVSGAVAWRRILIWLAEGDTTRREACFSPDGRTDKRLAFEYLGGFRRHAWWRYLFAVLFVVVTGWGVWKRPLADCAWLTGIACQVHKSLFILAVVYLLVMLYVYIVFVREKNRS